MEACRDALLDSRSGQQVPGDLLDREAVESHARVESVDDPAPVAPSMRPDIVLGIAVRVGIANLVQPVHGLLLAKVLRSQQSLYHSLVGSVSLVLVECTLLLASRRQAGQIQRHAS